jgi:hypothetical protein
VGLGDRVLTEEAGGALESGTAVMDPASWRAYSLRLTRADGTVTRVDLLRPVGWDLGETTTAAAKAAENARIKKIVDETGKVPCGS